MLEDYQKLLEYIPYFENNEIEFCLWNSGYPQYDEKLNEFIDTVYSTDLLKKDYLEYLEDSVKDHNLPAAIPTADLELLKAILTYYVRQERFCDGTWATAANDKVFLGILYRLRESEGGTVMKATINGNTLELVLGDITKLNTEAIVNAANGSLLGGGGVDGAIHRAAGPELLKECKKIRYEVLNGNNLPTGEAVITKGYNLPAKYVIHTVGPVWRGNTNNEEEHLSNCYQNSLKLAWEKDLKSISFPSISTGIFRFPIELAAAIALRTIIEFLKANQLGEVAMVLFSKDDFKVYESSLKRILAEK